MNQIRPTFEDQVVALTYPVALQRDIEALFPASSSSRHPCTNTIVVEEDDEGKFNIRASEGVELRGLGREICLLSVVGEVVRSLITGLDSGVALHAGAVS